MSVTKNWDINLRYSEKKTLRNFLSLYFFLCLCILSLLAITYYEYQKDIMLQNATTRLSLYASKQIKALRILHVNLNRTKKYPRDERFKSGIYDSSKKEIFSLLSYKPELGSLIYRKKDKIFYIRELESYYLGAKYLVLEIDDNKRWFYKVMSAFLSMGVLLVFIFTIFGYLLSRLFLRPMKDAIRLLDRFIKDTTHELNTPISTILSNIELINEKNLNQKDQIKLRRIDIGARTVSNLYQDLVYITLGHKVVSKCEEIDLKSLLEERLEYFSIFIQNRQIVLTKELTSSILLADRTKIVKLIDNLISNAIKYNIKNGKLHVVLKKKSFTICNRGKSIKKERISSMFDRYTRGDERVGGFGIGLHIVSMVAKEYKFDIEVKNYEKEGTCIKVSW